jgi:hypothetical protein
MQVGALKATNHNGYQLIIPPSQEMGAGLKILCSSQSPSWSRNDSLERHFGFTVVDPPLVTV